MSERQNFRVGEKVVFGVHSNGVPIWNIYKSKNIPWREIGGVVTASTKSTFVTRHRYNGVTTTWTWFQPTMTPERHARCWDEAAYVQRKERV